RRIDSANFSDKLAIKCCNKWIQASPEKTASRDANPSQAKRRKVQNYSPACKRGVQFNRPKRTAVAIHR
ncbi:MAG: hypothetical protein KBG84_10620, partial [Planctomycetes bacterium]|nr:hypothetical protein [Planctomycetota bacterium]